MPIRFLCASGSVAAPVLHQKRPNQSATNAIIQSLLCDLHHESVFSSISIDQSKLDFLVDTFLKHPRHVWLLYDSGDGRIEGLIMGYINEHFFSTELGAWDLAVFVRPERRGSMVAFRLFSEFRKWAATNGSKTPWLGTSARIKPARTRKFYTGLGMEEVGTLYRIALQP
jgi:GNAT superfamily N-acetyltransferase